jgi:hypothetical protein
MINKPKKIANHPVSSFNHALFLKTAKEPRSKSITKAVPMEMGKIWGIKKTLLEKRER